MKHEWKKHEKNLYGVKQSPRIVDIPMQQFIMIEGKGNPNDKDFSDKVSALYSLAYGIKMMYKNTISSNEVSDYTVYPLEAIWKDIGNTCLLYTSHDVIYGALHNCRYHICITICQYKCFISNQYCLSRYQFNSRIGNNDSYGW